MAEFFRSMKNAITNVFLTKPVCTFPKISQTYAHEWNPETSPSLKVKYSEIYKEFYHIS